MWVFALRFVRGGKRFELFYFTHLLYVAWFVLAIFHAPRFGFWAAVPLAGFAVEQILRLARRAPSSPIASSQALRSGVSRLEIERPRGFQFRAGDYAFLCIPAIARHEWHPFTISSAPEQARIVFHVRSLGDWTNALRKRVETQPDAPGFTAYVDGPYGAPSTRVFEARFVVLIGAGIGVTPFASILESLVLRSQDPARSSKVERVHFFWLNRDQYSFEWFVQLLAELEQKDTRGILDIHLHMTGARAGMASMGLEVARAIMRSGGRKDYVTGLRTETHVGPPDWDTMLGAISKNHAPETVEVFFCGPPGLETKLQKMCKKHGMTFTAEKF
jgi:predicted ferric reductase